MTLKLVDNVAPIGIYNPKLIPAVARTFADKVEAGEFGEVERAIVVLETDAGPLIFYWGEELSHFEAIGLLHMATHTATADGIEAFESDD